MPNVSDDKYVALYIRWGVKKRFTQAVEDWHGERKGRIAEEAEAALKEKTAELIAKIEARNGKR